MEEEAERIAALRKHRQGSEKISTVRRELNVTMEEGCGVYREQASMDATVRTIASLRDRVKDVRVEDDSMVFNTELIAALELVNMVDIPESVAQSAAVRNESRGAHTRKDFPNRDDGNFLHHSLCYFGAEGPRLGTKPVNLGHWEPEERKY